MEQGMVYLVVNEGDILFVGKSREEAQVFVQSLKDRNVERFMEKLGGGSSRMEDFFRACLEAGYEAEGCVISPLDLSGERGKQGLEPDGGEPAGMFSAWEESFDFEWDEE